MKKARYLKELSSQFREGHAKLGSVKLHCTISCSFGRMLFHRLQIKDPLTFINFYKFVPVCEVWYFFTDQFLFMEVA